jgi:hypothetical protein
MIYLIITTSIANRFGLKDPSARRQRYLYAISETLKHLPDTICPIIVENNGQRETYLDKFIHRGKPVRVIYTTNNTMSFRNKGANELVDIKEVIEKAQILDEDMVVKLTGRYRVLSAAFFNEVIEESNAYDAFVKFFGVCSGRFDDNDCVLGLYALRAKYYKLQNHLAIDNYKSAEIAFARYVRLCGAHIKEVKKLDMECCFAEDQGILIV